MKVADHKSSLIVEDKNSSMTEGSSKLKLAKTINESDEEDRNTNHVNAGASSAERPHRLGSLVMSELSQSQLAQEKNMEHPDYKNFASIRHCSKF